MAETKDIENTSENELIDDEDTIDRLLMDNELDESPSENTEVDDEFSEADFIKSTESESSSENELTEIDELNEDGITSKNAEQAAKENSEDTDDFLIADFDISTEDDEDTETLSDPVEEDTQAENIQQTSEPPSPEPRQDNEDTELSKTSSDELNAQISQLWAENETIKQQIAQLNDSSSANESDTSAEEIENLLQEQRKLKKAIKESDAKIPVVTYVALGIAIVALILSGVLGAIGLDAQSDAVQITELIATLEEEVDIIIAKDNSTDITALNNKINLLSAEDEILSKQLVDTKNSLKSTPLKPIIDDLIEQNDRAQRAIDQLLAKVESLEKRKFVSTSTKKPKKAKKVVAKVTWVVNLVSFKQQWYANRKAAEFEKKGIPVEVLKVKVNGQDWFRIRVKGFKSNYEAAAYAVKVKKTLNLSTVWVTKA